MAQLMTNAIRHIHSSADWDNVRLIVKNLIVGLSVYNIELMDQVLTTLSTVDAKVRELDGLEHDWCRVVHHNPLLFSNVLAEINSAIDEINKTMTFLILQDGNSR